MRDVERGRANYALSMTIASAIGPFLGMFLINHASFNADLIVCAITLGIGFITTFPLIVPKIALINQEVSIKEPFKISQFFEAKALPISFITALICFVYSSILTFLSAYAQSIHLIEAGSFFFIAYAGAILISRPFIGRWFDIKGENFVAYPTLFLFVFALIMLGRAHHGYSILLAGVLIGFSYGNFFAIGQALAVKLNIE